MILDMLRVDEVSVVGDSNLGDTSVISPLIEPMALEISPAYYTFVAFKVSETQTSQNRSIVNSGVGCLSETNEERGFHSAPLAKLPYPEID